MEKGPYYAIPQYPSVHHTMGGLVITPKTEVVDIFGNIIPGLYAAGEVTGGVHGTNRLGSNADADSCTFGFISGYVAATGEEVIYADVQKVSKKGGVITLRGELYNSEFRSDTRGTFVATAKPYKWDGKSTWAILSMSSELD